jgi:lysophospholipase L1-like esterase
MQCKRILFLGDSITHAGEFITLLEAQMLLVDEDGTAARNRSVINLGLPSETCSGLSEPDHPFPRPDVRERLERALDKIKPDCVVVCYGMNDAIYYPFSEERFAAYRKGLNEVIGKVKASGAKLILMTPPAFDPLPLASKDRLLPLGAEKYSWKAIYEGYDDVIKKYSDWVLAQNDRVDMTIDLHSAMNDYLQKRRATDPKYTMSSDGVHFNSEGHHVLANALCSAWGLRDLFDPDEGLKTLLSRRQQLMHSAWLSEVGHQRPGVKKGLPLSEALEQARELEKQIGPRVLRQQDRRKKANSDVHSFHVPASKKTGALALFVDYDLWIPPGVDHVQGIIVHQHGCGPGASNAGLTAVDDLHWRALAVKWDCALMGSSYEGRAGEQCRLWCDPRNGSRDAFLSAIEHFAEHCGHPELERAPWCLWGHSGGGFWASLMQISDPERIAAIWLQSGTALGYWKSGEIKAPVLEPDVYRVPVMACPGRKEQTHERFHRAWDGLHAMLRDYRKRNAPIGIAPDPRTGHECGDSRYLAIPFFDACLSMRLPSSSTDPNASGGLSDHTSGLRNIEWANAWLGDDQGNIFPASQIAKEDTQRFSWLPNASFARKWSSFVKDGEVPDVTAPPKPDGLTGTRIANEFVLRWSAVADLESGLRGFRVERNGKTVGELPAKRQSRFGRPIFQVMTYSGTPSQPLVEMTFREALPNDNVPATYRVYSVNSVGLESDAAAFRVQE